MLKATTLLLSTTFLLACTDINTPDYVGHISSDKLAMYQDISEQLGIATADIISICHTDYSSQAGDNVQYNLSCHWDENSHSFSIIYSEFDESGKANPNGEFSTLELNLTDELLSQNIIGISAMLYYPTKEKITDVESFELSITDLPEGWVNSVDYGFDYNAASSQQTSIISSSNDLQQQGIHVYNLADAEMKRFKVSSDVELDGEKGTIHDDIINTGLFSNIYQAVAFRS